MTNKRAPEEFPRFRSPKSTFSSVGVRGRMSTSLPKQLPWSVSGCSTRRRRIAFVTSLRRFWLKQGHRPEIAPSISSALRLLVCGVMSLILFGQCIDTPKLGSLEMAVPTAKLRRNAARPREPR
jgi:hypothetical protein